MGRSTRWRTLVAVKAAALAQVVGAALVVIGLGLWSPAIALTVGGIVLAVFGVAVELDERRKVDDRAR